MALKEVEKDTQIICFTIVNNTDQHLFLTEEHLSEGVNWKNSEAAKEQINAQKPVVIEKMGGSSKFAVGVVYIRKTEGVALKWQGGCDLCTFGFRMVTYNMRTPDIDIDTQRYTCSVKVDPKKAADDIKKAVAIPQKFDYVTITFDMLKKLHKTE
jgi:hypothetical protein